MAHVLRQNVAFVPLLIVLDCSLILHFSSIIEPLRPLAVTLLVRSKAVLFGDMPVFYQFIRAYVPSGGSIAGAVPGLRRPKRGLT